MSKQILQVSDQDFDFLHLFAEFLNTQSCETTETHVNYGLCLLLVKSESLHQSRFCLIFVAASTDDFYYLVNCINGNDESLKDMLTFLSFLQLKLGATYNHVVAVIHETFNQLLEIEDFRTTVHKRKIDYAET